MGELSGHGGETPEPHAEEYFLNLVELYQIWIVIKLFRSIWQ